MTMMMMIWKTTEQREENLHLSTILPVLSPFRLAADVKGVMSLLV